MKTQALKGMRDLLPAEQTLRDYIQGKILRPTVRPASSAFPPPCWRIWKIWTNPMAATT